MNKIGNSKKQQILVDTNKWETNPSVTSRLAGRGLSVNPEDDESPSPRDTGRALGTEYGEDINSFAPYEEEPGDSYGERTGMPRNSDDPEMLKLYEAIKKEKDLNLGELADSHPNDETNSTQLQQGYGGRHKRKRRTKKVKRGGKSKKSGRSRRRSKRRSTRK
jgi:hypothetical protein